MRERDCDSIQRLGAANERRQIDCFATRRGLAHFVWRLAGYLVLRLCFEELIQL